MKLLFLILIFSSNVFCKTILKDINGNTAKVDSTVSALRVIAVEHAEIHAGEHFIACDYDNDVDAAKIWRFTSPNTTTQVHLTGLITSSLNGVVQLYANPTITGAGTTFTANNNNGRSTNTATTVFAYDTTASGNGTLVFSQVIGTDGTTPQGNSGGFAKRTQEIILAQNEDYLLIYTPEGTDNRVSVCFEFYEQD